MQKAMINIRLNLLDAFLHPEAREIKSYFCAGKLVLVDLTDPFLDGEHIIIMRWSGPHSSFRTQV
jgi:hypothetical protein